MAKQGKVGKFTAQELKKVAERKMDEFREALIEEVRGYPFLFDRANKDFKDTGLVNKTWMEIGKSLSHPTQECKDEWKRLRDLFVRERKFLNNTVSGQGSVKNHKDFKFYQTMMFLDQVIKPRRSRSTLGEYRESEEEDNSQSESQTTELVFNVDDPELLEMLTSVPKKRLAQDMSPVRRKSPRKTLFVDEEGIRAPPSNTAKKATTPMKSPMRTTPAKSPAKEKPGTPPKPSPKPKGETHVLAPHLPMLSPSKEYKAHASASKERKTKTDDLIGEGAHQEPDDTKPDSQPLSPAQR